MSSLEAFCQYPVIHQKRLKVQILNGLNASNTKILYLIVICRSLIISGVFSSSVFSLGLQCGNVLWDVFPGKFTIEIFNLIKQAYCHMQTWFLKLIILLHSHHSRVPGNYSEFANWEKLIQIFAVLHPLFPSAKCRTCSAYLSRLLWVCRWL